MESEVKFASLSLAPGFPIVVPRTLFADYHSGTGTGILISERITSAPTVSSRSITSAWTTRCQGPPTIIGRC